MQKPTLNPADISLVIDAMKVVFPTKEEVNKIVEQQIDKKLQFAPSWAAINQRLDELLTQEEFNKKISILPTKEEFATPMDKLSKEYEKIDQAETLHADSLSKHDDELENLDERVKVLELRHTSKPTPAVSD